MPHRFWLERCLGVCRCWFFSRSTGFKRVHPLGQFCNLALEAKHLSVGIRLQLAELLAELTVQHEQINHQERGEQDNNAVEHQEGHGPSSDQGTDDAFVPCLPTLDLRT